MPPHPPWLRFQAYIVGLPKTGSTSMATIFGNYRSCHEWQLMELLGFALARRRGDLSDGEFLRSAGRRLVPASLEMDSTTCHYLYTDLLRDQFPQALFIHTVRDVISWISSLLDMVFRKRVARQIINIPYSTWESDYLALMTEGRYDLAADEWCDDRPSLAPLMRFWAAHIHEMAGLLPDGRSLRIRTSDIRHQLQNIADFTGVPVSSLRSDLVHVNRSPCRLDRFTAFDSDEVRAVYDEECADIMAEVFPSEHRAWMAYRSGGLKGGAEATGWDKYRADVKIWVADAIRLYGPTAAH